VAVAAPTLVVLAAGLGHRFGGLKQFEPVGPHGEPLVDYAVFDALHAGFARVVFVIRREIAVAFDARIASRYRGRVPIACALQALDDLPDGSVPLPSRQRPWGTLHAVLAARELFDGPFAVINADDFYGRAAYEQAATFLGDLPAAPPEPCCMVGYRLHATLSASGGVHRAVGLECGSTLGGLQEVRDIRRDDDGVCRGVAPSGERVALRDDALVSMNIWGFAPSVLKAMTAALATFVREHGHDPAAECLLPAFVDRKVRSGGARCRILDGGSGWFGITHPQDRADCMRRIGELTARGVYGSPLWR
jgi:hypothetical protein